MKKTGPHQPSLIAVDQTPKEIFRTIRNYLAGQFVGATRDDALLEEVLKCLFCKLIVEQGEKAPIEVTADSFDVAKQVRAIFATVRDKFPEIYARDAEILLDPASLQFVMRQLHFSIMDSDSDPIGDAFEVFVGSESRGNSGQFFTPRSVTNLLVEAINPQSHESVLDPACGAGGFLASVCAHLQRSGVPAKDLSRNLYGIDKDSYLAQLAKVHISLLTGEHPTVVNGDSLSLTNGSKNIRDYLPPDGVDVILTNPPFGSKIIAANQELLATFSLARKWVTNRSTGQMEPGMKISLNVPPQVLFVERCLSLLKPGGRLGMVLPESILSNKSYRHVVEYLLHHSEVEAVVGMPEALFKTSGKGGTHTKTCLLVATKSTKQNIDQKYVFMAEAKWCGQDSRARVIPHNDLPTISGNYSSYRTVGSIPLPGPLGFLTAVDQLNNGVLCPRYYDPEAALELVGLQNTHELVTIGALIEDGTLTITTGHEVGKLAYGTGQIPFVRTSDISNWEIKADPKHGVSDAIYESLKQKQDVRTNDVLMVKDGTYLIGTCAIVTDADNQMVYQSHLYKIRVEKNTHSLDPYLFLALLSSTAVQKQIKSKQFTQDIIDSLGTRIHELILPIPKAPKRRNEISNLVQKAVANRIEARSLTLRARELVCDLL